MFSENKTLVHVEKEKKAQSFYLCMNIHFNFKSQSLIPTLYNHAHLLSHKDGIMQINNLNCALKRNPLSL